MFDVRSVSSGSMVVICLLCVGSLLAEPGSVARADVPGAVKKLLPAVVAVEWRAEKSDEGVAQTDDRADPARIVIFARPDAVSFSSGTVVSPDGLVVTAHAAEQKGRLSVTFPDGRTLPARLLVDDRRTDLQLLKVDAGDLPHIQLSDEKVEMGQQVVSVVCTDLKDRAAAAGIIAATARSVAGTFAEMLQTDVQVQAMSAGAPLADPDGQVVGIIVAKAAGNERRGGASFAVPAKYVKALLDARKGDETVVVHRGLLGIQLRDAEEAGMAPVVHGVIPDSAAAQAGIRTGDEIVAIEGQKVASPQEVIQIVGRHTANEKVVVTIRRDGQEERVDVTLGKLPEHSYRKRAQVESVQPGSLYALDKDGNLRMVTPDDLRQPLAVRVLPGLTAEQYQKVLEQYQKVLAGQAAEATAQPLTRLTIPLGGHQDLQPLTIRVQRTEMDKKIDQLGEQVKALQQQVEKLTEELKKRQSGP